MPDRPIACAPCVRRTLHDRRRTLDKLTRAHAAARARLERAMGPRDDAAVDAALASERARAVADDLRDARTENARVASAIREERAKLATMREALAGRAAALDAARATTRSRRTAMFQSTAPEETRLHSLRLKSTREQLAVERAGCIARLRFVFPIAAERAAAENEGIEGTSDPNDSKSMMTKNAVNGDPRFIDPRSDPINTRDLQTTKPKPPSAVTVCGLRVPDPGDTRGLNPHEICAGLGMTLELLRLACFYLGVPALHRGAFRGSDSEVWTRGSFWDDEPADGDVKLRLYLPEKVGGEVRGGGDAGEGAGEGGGKRSGNKFDRRLMEGLNRGLNRGIDRVEAALHDIDTNGRVASAVGAVAGGIGTVAGGIGTGIGRVGAVVYETGERALNLTANQYTHPHTQGRVDHAEWSKQADKEAAAADARAELHRATRLLHRSAGALCADARHALGASPPKEWGPLATLALVLTTLARGAPNETFPDARPWLASRRLSVESEGAKGSTKQRHRRRSRGEGEGDAESHIRHSTRGIAGALAGKLGGAWEMRESAAIAPALQRAAHSGLSGAQSLMSSVFGGRPGHLNQGLNQGAHQTTSGGQIESRRGTIRENGPEFSDDETDYGGVVVSSAMAESTWQLVDAPRRNGGVRAQSSSGAATILPPTPESHPEDVERWMRTNRANRGT